MSELPPPHPLPVPTLSPLILLDSSCSKCEKEKLSIRIIFRLSHITHHLQCIPCPVWYGTRSILSPCQDQHSFKRNVITGPKDEVTCQLLDDMAGEVLLFLFTS
jgi:hypothetical protein